MLTLSPSARRTTDLPPAAWGRLALAIGLLGLPIAAAHGQLSAVRISEVLAGANDAQAIELFNAGPAPVSLNGAVIASNDEARTLSGLAAIRFS